MYGPLKARLSTDATSTLTQTALYFFSLYPAVRITQRITENLYFHFDFRAGPGIYIYFLIKVQWFEHKSHLECT